MKKLFAALLAACLLVGCQPGGPDQSRALEQVGEPFTTTARVQYGEVAATLQIDAESPRSYTLQFSEPAALKDLTMVFTEEKVQVAFRGMEVSVKPEALTEGALGRMLMDSVQQAAGEENLQIVQEDGVLVVQGSAEGGAFELRLDGKTGNFLSLAFPENDFYMEFSGFRFY